MVAAQLIRGKQSGEMPTQRAVLAGEKPQAFTWTDKGIAAFKPRQEVEDFAHPKPYRGLTLRVLGAKDKDGRWGTRAKTWRWRWKRGDKKAGRKGSVITLGEFSPTKAAGCLTHHEAQFWFRELKLARKSKGASGLEAKLAEMQVSQRASLPPGATSVPSVPKERTVAGLAERFLTERIEASRKPEGARLARYMIEKELLPSLGPIELKALTAEDCKRVIKKAADRTPARAMGAKSFRLLKQMLKWGTKNVGGYQNPFSDFDAKEDFQILNRKRKRFLGETGDGRAELTAYLKVLAGEDGPPVRRLRIGLRLLLLLGCRPGALRLSTWSDVDFETRTLRVPPSRQKLTKAAEQEGAVDYYIPLGPTALALFQELRRISDLERNPSPLVFPSRQHGRGRPPHEYSKSIFRAAMKDVMARPEMQGFAHATSYDNRRTFRTWASKLGIPRDVAERCLSHVVKGVEGNYNIDDLLLQRREAHEKWDAFLLGLLAPPAGSNVVPLSAAVAR